MAAAVGGGECRRHVECVENQEAIRAFVEAVGLTKQNSLSDFALLEFEVRSFLNKTALRKMAVLDPVKVVVTNYPEGKSEEVKGQGEQHCVEFGLESSIRPPLFLVAPPFQPRFSQYR